MHHWPETAVQKLCKLSLDVVSAGLANYYPQAKPVAVRLGECWANVNERRKLERAA